MCSLASLFSGVGSQSGNAARAVRGPGTGTFSHGGAEQDGQEPTDPLFSCPVPETQGRVSWRPLGYNKFNMGCLQEMGKTGEEHLVEESVRHSRTQSSD